MDKIFLKLHATLIRYMTKSSTIFNLHIKYLWLDIHFLWIMAPFNDMSYIKSFRRVYTNNIPKWQMDGESCILSTTGNISHNSGQEIRNYLRIDNRKRIFELTIKNLSSSILVQDKVSSFLGPFDSHIFHVRGKTNNSANFRRKLTKLEGINIIQ